MDMRGLAHFIQDIRDAGGDRCKEANRVDEELANIRANFVDSTNMTVYARKKYVCKLMFISMLGYPIKFGHMEAARLMAGNTSSEKLIGYLAMTVLLNEKSDFLCLTTHTVFQDLTSGVDLNRVLALTATANMTGGDLLDVMHSVVPEIVRDTSIDIHVRKKSLLALLKIHRRNSALVDLTQVMPATIDLLESEQTGVAMCALTFLLGCVHMLPMKYNTQVTSAVVDLLYKMIIDKVSDVGYVYYGVPAPWLQCKTLQLLQHFPAASDPVMIRRISLVLQRIVKSTANVHQEAQTQQKQRGAQNRVSAMNAVLVEVVTLAIAWNVIDTIHVDCAQIISKLITEKRESNMRYLGLELLSQLNAVKGRPEFTFQTISKNYQPHIIVSLYNADVSLRRKTLDVLSSTCNTYNASDVISELTTYLPMAKETFFRTELVSLIARLSEQYSIDDIAHAERLLTVIAQAGDACPDAVFMTTIRLVIGNAAIQKQACGLLFFTLQRCRHASQVVLRLAAFILGEFGYQVALNPETTPQLQFNVLHRHLARASDETRGLLLTTFVKFFNVYDDAVLRTGVRKVLHAHVHAAYPEFQQRAREYLALIDRCSAETLTQLFKPFPARDGMRPESTDHHNAELLPHTTSPLVSYVSGPLPHPRTLTLPASSTTAEDVAALDKLFSVPTAQEAHLLRKLYDSAYHRFVVLTHDADEGVIFSDGSIEVHCAQEYRLADGRLTLRVRRISDDAIDGVSAQLTHTESGLLLQLRARDTADATSLTNSDPPKADVLLTVDIAARCLAPFTEAPSVQILYRTKAATQYVVRTFWLPILSTCFISAYHNLTETELKSLYERIKRDSVSRTATFTSSKMPFIDVARRMGLQIYSTTTTMNQSEYSVVGLGAHATQREYAVQYQPVACEFVQYSDTGRERVVLYAPDPVLCDAMRYAIAMHLHIE